MTEITTAGSDVLVVQLANGEHRLATQADLAAAAAAAAQPAVQVADSVRDPRSEASQAPADEAKPVADAAEDPFRLTRVVQTGPVYP